MTEATQEEHARMSEIDWRMSAALENVPRGDEELAEVTSLAGAVRAWLDLDAEHRKVAVLMPEQPIAIGGATYESLAGEGIQVLADHLPEPSSHDQ